MCLYVCVCSGVCVCLRMDVFVCMPAYVCVSVYTCVMCLYKQFTLQTNKMSLQRRVMMIVRKFAIIQFILLNDCSTSTISVYKG